MWRQCPCDTEEIICEAKSGGAHHRPDLDITFDMTNLQQHHSLHKRSGRASLRLDRPSSSRPA